MILDDCSCSYTPNHPGVISLIVLSWEITFCREPMYWHHLVPPRTQVPSLDEECAHPWTRPGVRAKRILADQKLGSCVANPVLNHNYCFGQLLHMNSGYDVPTSSNIIPYHPVVYCWIYHITSESHFLARHWSSDPAESGFPSLPGSSRQVVTQNAWLHF